MADFEGCFNRIKSRTPIKTQKDLAEEVGVRPSSINAAKKRGNMPEKWIFNIGKKYNISSDWIISGEEKHSVVEDGAENYQAGKVSKFIQVPIYDVKVSAGHGNMIHSEEVSDHLAFQRDWIEERGLKEDFLALVIVDGDSMAPTLLDSDLILINRGILKIKGDAIYVLNFDGDLQVKRIQKQPNGDLVIQSDNLAYKPYTVKKSEADTLTVIGSVVWFARNI